MRSIWCVNQFVLPPDQAGGTRHFGLAKALRSHGIDLTLVGSPVNYASGELFRQDHGETVLSETVDGVRFAWLPQSPRGASKGGRLASMLRFGRAVARGSWTNAVPAPDAVLGSSPSLFGAWGAARQASVHDVPFVLEVRDVWPQSIVDVAGVPAWHPGVLAMRGLEQWLYRRADHTVTLLPGAADHIAKRGGNPDAITWIPNGVDLSGWTGAWPTGAQSKAEQDRVRVVYMGAHGPANALESIVDAAKLLWEAGETAIQFDFYGAGPSRDALRQQASPVPTVTFHDSVPKRHVPSVLANADVLVANMKNIGLYRHGISFNKLFDYMASGVPTVFGSAAVGDPIAASGAGVSVTPDDPQALANAVRMLAAATPEERRTLGERGRRYVEFNHSMDYLAERLAIVLHEVTA